MQTIADSPPVVNRPRIYHNRLYAQGLVTYQATWRDAHGAIAGTARELYAHGSATLEFLAEHFAERRIVRRNDGRLTLAEVL